MEQIIINTSLQSVKSIFDGLTGKNHYIIIGAPHAGKTTFFITMIDALQREGNQTEKFIFEQKSPDSIELVRSNLLKMENGGWPEKTQSLTGKVYSFQIKSKGIFLNITYDIVYYDHAGEAFYSAFEKPYSVPVPKEDPFFEDAMQLRRAAVEAKGVFLVLDSIELYDCPNLKLDKCLVNLFGILNDKNTKLDKIAVIFGKWEVVKNLAYSAKELFYDRYPNAVACLRGGSAHVNFFGVETVGNLTVNPDGYYVPVKGYRTKMGKGLVAPAKWMLGI